jgi:hypothetical protein
LIGSRTKALAVDNLIYARNLICQPQKKKKKKVKDGKEAIFCSYLNVKCLTLCVLVFTAVYSLTLSSLIMCSNLFRAFLFSGVNLCRNPSDPAMLTLAF